MTLVNRKPVRSDQSPESPSIVGTMNQGYLKTMGRTPVHTITWSMISDLEKLNPAFGDEDTTNVFHPQIQIVCTNYELPGGPVRNFTDLDPKPRTNASMFYRIQATDSDQLCEGEIEQWLTNNEGFRNRMAAIDRANNNYEQALADARARCETENPTYIALSDQLNAAERIVTGNSRDSRAKGDVRRIKARMQSEFMDFLWGKQDLNKRVRGAEDFAHIAVDRLVRYERRLMQNSRSAKSIREIIEVVLANAGVSGEFLYSKVSSLKDRSVLERITGATQTTPGGLYQISGEAFGKSLPQTGLVPADYFPVELIEVAMANVNQVIAGGGMFCIVPFNLTEGSVGDANTVENKHETVVIGKFWQGGWRVYLLDPAAVYYARMNVGHRRFFGDVSRFLDSCGRDAVVLPPEHVQERAPAFVIAEKDAAPAVETGTSEDATEGLDLGEALPGASSDDDLPIGSLDLS